MGWGSVQHVGVEHWVNSQGVRFGVGVDLLAKLVRYQHPRDDGDQRQNEPREYQRLVSFHDDPTHDAQSPESPQRAILGTVDTLWRHDLHRVVTLGLRYRSDDGRCLTVRVVNVFRFFDS